jgi:6-pyruvoyltetrahydropterin/6-carboxytetrahydropterin synthase
MHGHNWAVRAEVSSGELDSMGLVMDFRRLKAMLDDITADFDDRELEAVEYFRQNNPSAEAVAKYIYEKLEPKLPGNVNLEGIRVIEEQGCSAKFGK